MDSSSAATSLLDRKSNLLLELHLPNSHSIRSLATVAWVKAMPEEDSYEIGGMFVEPTHDARAALEINRLGALTESTCPCRQPDDRGQGWRPDPMCSPACSTSPCFVTRRETQSMAPRTPACTGVEACIRLHVPEGDAMNVTIEYCAV